MIKSKKQMYLVIGAFALVMLLGTVTYAFFNYTRTGSANTIRVGRIAFRTNQTETITLNNLFPIDPTETGIMDDETKVGTLEVEVTGDTDYSKGIEYLISSVDSNITLENGKTIPLSLQVSASGLGTSNVDYFNDRESATSSMYKNIVGDTLLGNQMLLVGFIKPNTTSGTVEGVNGKITIKAYLDENKILISDTYDGTDESIDGKTVITTEEWNALQTNGLSFKIRVEANTGIWVNGSLEEIMRKTVVMDNINSEFVNNTTPGINFGAVSGDTNGKGVYMRAGTENDAYPIMYYRGAVEDNNVMFANKCWKTVRTTDTGGVKLIYNGLPGEVYESVPLEEPSYTKNTTNTDSRWTFDSTDNTWNIEVDDNSQPAIEFTVPAGDNYSLVLTGTSGSSCGGSYYIYKDGTQVVGNGFGGGQALNITQAFGTLTASNVIKMNYTGSSSSSCAMTFKLQMVGQGDLVTSSGCINAGTDTHISVEVNGTPQNMFAFNTNYNSPAYVGYMYGTVYTYSNSNWTSNAKFGSSFTWDGTNYKLVDASVTTPNATHHYSCNSTDAEATCTDLRYVYYVNSSIKYYITLTGGDGIEEALTKMQTNTTDSNAKDKIDTWYLANMTSYTNKLEDTVWCNDRSIGRANGWSATGGLETSAYKHLLFGASERSNHASDTSTVKNQPSLACTNKNDRFTVNNANGNQALTYPTALLTEDEMVLAGGLAVLESTFYLSNGNADYWSLSPYTFVISSAVEFLVDSSGDLDGYYVDGSCGLRPAVSLKPGTPVVKGTGTATDPYLIG